jgi:hypothetical protein
MSSGGSHANGHGPQGHRTLDTVGAGTLVISGLSVQSDGSDGAGDAPRLPCVEGPSTGSSWVSGPV